MTGKEVAILALERKKPPRTPVTLIAGGEWYVHAAGQTFAGIRSNPQKLAQVYVEAFRKVGHDLMWPGAGLLNYPAHFLGAPLRDDSSDSPVLEGAAIKGLDEVDSLRVETVLDNPDMKSMIEAYHLLADQIGREVLLIATQWGPFATAARILGTEAFMLATAMDPERVKKLMDFSTKLNWAMAERIMAHPDLAGLNLSEPVASGDMISPVTFRSLAAPYLKDMVGRTRRAGKYSSLHICGNSLPMLDDVLDIGPDCFSLEAKVDLKAAKEKLAGRVCVAGNVAPSGAFWSGSPEEVKREARQCLEAWGGDPGYILTVGCDFPKTVPLENVRALMSFKDEAL